MSNIWLENEVPTLKGMGLPGGLRHEPTGLSLNLKLVQSRRLDRITVVRYGKWMGPISKADVVNCDQFVTTNPPPSTLGQGHTHAPVFALNWEKRFVRRNCFNYFPARQEAPDRFEGCEKEESLCLSPSKLAEIAQKLTWQQRPHQN